LERNVWATLMKAYSLDLRQKIINVYQHEQISQRQLAKRFNVATSFIIKLLKQYRQTGSIEPKAHGGGNPAKLSAQYQPLVAELVAANNDATILELCAQFEQRAGMRVSRSTMGRAVQQLKLTVKKNLSSD
jgi:transposase